VGAFFLIVGVVLVCLLINFLCRIWLLALGFQRHWGWGVALLLQLLFYFGYFGASPATRSGLLPGIGTAALFSEFIVLAFIVTAWAEAKQPFFWFIGSICVAILVVVGSFFYAIESSQRLKDLMEARGVSTAFVNQVAAWGSNTPRPGAQPRAVSMPGTQNASDRQDPGTATPPPVFQSRLPPRRMPPGQREPVQPGIFYLVERVTTRNWRGVQNGLPGEKVILLNRLPRGKLRVTVGNADFVVDASQVTDDPEVAREAEKRDFVARGGQL
jgi:hypothetical protein